MMSMFLTVEMLVTREEKEREMRENKKEEGRGVPIQISRGKWTNFTVSRSLFSNFFFSFLFSLHSREAFSPSIEKSSLGAGSSG